MQELTLVVITRKIKRTLKYVATASKITKSKVTLATCIQIELTGVNDS
jgi:hypothetical protein